MEDRSTLHYLISGSPTPISVSPFDSDILTNAVVMEQVIGTLIKYGSSGRYEPYIAKSWISSKDGLVWTFSLRENLFDQNGDPITAESYSRALRPLLWSYGAENSDLPAFSKMKGWKKFLSGPKNSALEGLKATSNNEVQFYFENKPEGLLEYLAMPYYGFYSFKDFNPRSLDWRSKKEITSTGAYEVEKISDDKILLKKREQWFTNHLESPASVNIAFTDFQNALKQTSHSIIHKKINAGDSWGPEFSLVTSTPTVLIALVISPFKEGIFQKLENREILISKIQKIKSETPFTSPNVHLGSSFYFTSPDNQPISEKFEKNFIKGSRSEIDVSFSGSPDTPQNQYIKSLLKESLKDSGISVNFIQQDRKKSDWLSDARSNKKFDIRIAAVDIGGNIENWVIRMMFCSTMGVSFPDHNGKMCSLVEKFEQGEISQQDYPIAFNEIIRTDATTVPLWHTSQTWLFSKDIDIHEFSPSMNLPRFDLVRLK